MDELRATIRSVIRKFLLIGLLAYVVGGLLIAGALAPGLLPGVRAPGWVLALAGIFMLIMGWLAWFYGPRWYRRALWVTETTAPSVVGLKIQVVHDADRSRSLRAQLSPPESDAAASKESIGVQWPDWNVETLPEGTAHVFRDPRSNDVLMIRTERGWLLPVPGGRIGRRKLP